MGLSLAPDEGGESVELQQDGPVLFKSEFQQFRGKAVRPHCFRVCHCLHRIWTKVKMQRSDRSESPLVMTAMTCGDERLLGFSCLVTDSTSSTLAAINVTESKVGIRTLALL